MSGAPPPSYSDTQATASTTNRSLPEIPPRYQVGPKVLSEPFVNSRQLKAHLSLLDAFFNLRKTVEQGSRLQNVPWIEPLNAEQKWAWFVTLAVERFQRWVTIMMPDEPRRWAANESPPLDVWMVWHSYLLNPRVYAEDCSRVPAMRSFALLQPGHFFDVLTALGDLNAYMPSESRARAWLSQTRTEWDPFDSASSMTNQELRCPQCRSKVIAPYITDSGTGYAQQGFSVQCLACGMAITKEKLAAAKFCTDLAYDMDAPEYIGSTSAFLANTVRTPEHAVDQVRAKRIKQMILLAPSFAPRRVRHGIKVVGVNLKAEEMAANVAWSMTYIRDLPVHNNKMLRRVLSAYTDQRPFSIDLVGAVLRQGSFVQKMHDLDWTSPGFFDKVEDEVALKHAVVRYHAFLDMMASSPGSFYVPTLDIDLAWHSHQLTAEQYQHDCKATVGRYVDHDDKVEEGHLSNAFDLTCRAWNARYNVPYMHCGCPLPGDSIGQKLSRLVSKIESRSYSSSALDPPEEHPYLLAATHPSDHNGVAVEGLPHVNYNQQRRAREAKLQKRRERDAQKVEKGKLDRAAYDRGRDHYPAFLIPVPIFFPAYGVGGCVAAGGGWINSGGGCGGIGSCAAGTGAMCGGAAGGGGCAGGGGGCGGGASGGGCGGGGGGGGCGGGGGGGGCGGGGGGGGGGGCGGG